MFNSKHTNLHIHRIELWLIDITQRNGKYTKMFSNSTYMYVAFSMLYMNVFNYLKNKTAMCMQVVRKYWIFPY